jgi:hypothetical protein
MLAAAALVSAILVAGCGGGSSNPPVATVGGANTSGSKVAASGSSAANSGSAAPTQSQLVPDELKFAECMRSNGVPNFPDPSASGGFNLRAGSAADQAAQAKCEKFLPGDGLPGAGPTHPSAALLAHWLRVSQCMREHSVYDFPDPTASIPSIRAGLGEISDRDGVILVFPHTIDQQSPVFTRAAAACGFQLTNH